MLAIIRDGIVTNLVEGDEGTVDRVQSYTVGIVTFVPEVLETDEKQQYYVSIGSSYIDGKFVPPEQEPIDTELLNEQIAFNVRSQRNFLLMQSDIKMLTDNWNSMDADLQFQWVEYRQELRNIPEQEGFPRDVIWPTEPNSNPVGVAST